ncbi:uncharacterized protein Z518_06089 [Rhinocladiella mackenziei CBS 650.93]|uniref:Uncharacterized protein n=1 Tax=Rhinocladiella mackenziei CBS 650.93 TaxID=1442369 RepID=A0A0D2FSX1_9EURO|nr:uncharacterized protein Z518_06089 [Rhinocladiella mackenziei CBS 650.93]KIX05217.1 hypothetical protein Z518_06089 [Rhinocladiella mackenziei CBS 650.93]
MAQSQYLPLLPQGESPGHMDISDDINAGALPDLYPTPSATPATVTPRADSIQGETPLARTALQRRREMKGVGAYRDLPSFPPFDRPIPNDATLEEICIFYPNHIRGACLDAFVQWMWSATDIYNHLTEEAKREFREEGVARCKAYGNRANFLMKRLDAHLKKMTAEEVRALCTAPKIRGCLIDGSEYYGASKLQGKFNNPNAQPVRSFPNRKKGIRRNTDRPAAAADQPQTVIHGFDGFSLWDSQAELEKYSNIMADLWTQQCAFAELIISSDAHLFNVDGKQRNDFILQLMKWPVTAESQTFFNFDPITACPTFVEWISNKVRYIVASVTSPTDLSVPSLAMPGNISQREKLNLARRHAVSLVLAEGRALVSKLYQVALGPDSATQTGVMKVGLVHQMVHSISSPEDGRNEQTSVIAVGDDLDSLLSRGSRRSSKRNKVRSPKRVTFEAPNNVEQQGSSTDPAGAATSSTCGPQQYQAFTSSQESNNNHGTASYLGPEIPGPGAENASEEVDHRNWPNETDSFGDDMDLTSDTPNGGMDSDPDWLKDVFERDGDLSLNMNGQPKIMDGDPDWLKALLKEEFEGFGQRPVRHSASM